MTPKLYNNVDWNTNQKGEKYPEQDKMAKKANQIWRNQ